MSNTLKELYDKYRNAIVRVTVRDSIGDLHIGTAFHVGDGWIVTARHVLDGNIIEDLRVHPYFESSRLEYSRVVTPDDVSVDLALVETDFPIHWHRSNYIKLDESGAPIILENCVPATEPGPEANHIPIGGHLDDWLGDELVLTKVLLLGFPSVPWSQEIGLVAVAGEVNAVIDKYVPPRHPHFIISPLGRGGFSGGPVISEYDFLLGVMTETLYEQDQLPELGFAAALTVEPLWNLLHVNGIYPSTNSDFLHTVYDRRGADFMAGFRRPPESS